MAIPGAYGLAASASQSGGGFHFLTPRRNSIEIYDEDNKEETQVICLAFRPENKIHLFPPAKRTARILRETIRHHWTIDSESPGINCYTIFLEGTPFLIYTRRERALLIKYICCLILEQFRKHGWDLVLCTDLSSKTDLTTWYFARAPPIAVPVEVAVEEGHAKKAHGSSGDTSLICLSLSSKRKLQLINAPKSIQKLLRDLVTEAYEPGFDQDAHYGRDYQIKLKGSPWNTTNREEAVAACELLIAAFREFGVHGYHLYGLVNLKDTADSFFFEYDPAQTFHGDEFMIVALDEHNLLRVINGNTPVIDLIKETVDRFWPPGFVEASERIAAARKENDHPEEEEEERDEHLSWEFVLGGSPWRATTGKIGRSRQLITFLLDALIEIGWTVVTGLDISRALHKKSALLFRRCLPMRDIHHVCASPLGEQNYQLINVPPHLRQLVRQVFGPRVVHEKTTDDGSTHELMLDGGSWWVADPEHDRDSFINTRRRMGRLLETLMAANWRVVASADVAEEIQDDEGASSPGQGIHSWFLVYYGNSEEEIGGGKTVLDVAGRIGGVKTTMMLPTAGRQRIGRRLETDEEAKANPATRSRSLCVRAGRAMFGTPPPPPGYSETLERLRARKRSDTVCAYRRSAKK